MKNRISLPFLIMLAAWVFVLELNGQSGQSDSLTLPPKGWNVNDHILYGLIVTNKPGDYPLPQPWVGVEKTTARTGYYAGHFEIASETNQLIRLKTLTVSPSLMPAETTAYRYIFDIPENPFPDFAYRSSLPTDAELLQMHDVASIRDFCYGSNSKHLNFSRTIMFEGNYFTLRPYNSIDTLHVEFLRYAGSSEITNVLVRRSHCSSQSGQ
jgi:hypothetical protein